MVKLQHTSTFFGLFCRIIATNVVTRTKLPTQIDERERQDYFTPSSDIFDDYCRDIVKRYNLSPAKLIRKETVLDIDHHSSSIETDQYFTVTTTSGVHHALAVVLAVGAGNAPFMPPELTAKASSLEGACHAFDITTFPPPHIQAKIAARKPTNIVVIGGGLTSAQLSDLAIKHGVLKVWHLMRSPLKSKYPRKTTPSWHDSHTTIISASAIYPANESQESHYWKSQRS